MQVDIAASKTCWFGESEKLVQKIFDDYKMVAKKVTTKPLLLFNEADALLNKRFENPGQSTDKTENSIQNIILQAMEELDGILIATTNLAKNLDKAFERRFLYKIEFEKPNLEARRGIWRAMLPQLAEGDIAELAGDFDLTGGQIENIARKNVVNQILRGQNQIPLERLRKLCAEELGEQGRVMGFC
jgi:SpoVK/Ycf46/Vps4 family AAA+-type ATPase